MWYHVVMRLNIELTDRLPYALTPLLLGDAAPILREWTGYKCAENNGTSEFMFVPEPSESDAFPEGVEKDTLHFVATHQIASILAF